MIRKNMITLLSAAVLSIALTGCQGFTDMGISGMYVDFQTGAVEMERGDTELSDTEDDQDFFEDWTADSKAAASIREYVERVTDPDSEDFIPESDRIAVFDMDGTLIGETYPAYFEYMMFIHRALYDESYDAPEDMKEFARALEEGVYSGNEGAMYFATLPKGNERLHAEYAGKAYAGMTPSEIMEYAEHFMESEAEGFTDLTKGGAIYKPMADMLSYLQENDFQCYIVSGSDRNICRAFAKDVFGIPENRVIGMSYKMVATGQGDTDGLDYLYTEDDEVVSSGELLIKTIKMNKVSVIAEEIGKVPVLAFGNSSGDLSMAQYVKNNKQYEGRAYMVLCDDLEREYGSMEKADSLREFCEEHGFETISMRDDFATIYDNGSGAAVEKDVEELAAAS
ncbi:MAG: haloacid dehalogenase-like hydrolase [Lachnospiraceae bacterium]|nr:haloacid dehalogenase-like hydrolase [Lachnospiraceae bacterium]